MALYQFLDDLLDIGIIMYKVVLKLRIPNLIEVSIFSMPPSIGFAIGNVVLCRTESIFWYKDVL